MTIDKRISYQWGGPGGKSPGTSASGGMRGGDGGGREQAVQQAAARQVAARQVAARQAEQQAAAQREMQATIAAAEKAAVQKARTAADTQTRMSGHMSKQKPVTTGPSMVAGPMDYLQPGYKPPTGTGEELGSIAGPIQGLINQPKIAGPIQGLINQPQAAPMINPFEQPGARTTIPRPPVRSRIQDERAEDIRKRALGNIALQTDKSLTDVSDPQRQGIMSSLMDTGKSYVKSAAPYMALNTLGLGALNPYLGIAKALGFDPIGSLMANLPRGTGTKTAFQPSEGGGDGRVQEPVREQAPANVIEASIQEFLPDQMNMIKQRHSQLQEVIDSGVYQGRQLTAEEIQMLQQKSLDIQKLMEQYLVDPKTMMAARGGIARLYG